jgi:hypothetical protein
MKYEQPGRSFSFLAKACTPIAIAAAANGRLTIMVYDRKIGDGRFLGQHCRLQQNLHVPSHALSQPKHTYPNPAGGVQDFFWAYCICTKHADLAMVYSSITDMKLRSGQSLMRELLGVSPGEQCAKTAGTQNSYVLHQNQLQAH